MATAFHKRRPELPRREYREEYYLPDSQGVGLDTLHRDNRHAELGSRDLREATNKAIFKWGFKHGITADQARVLLMDRRMP